MFIAACSCGGRRRTRREREGVGRGLIFLVTVWTLFVCSGLARRPHPTPAASFALLSLIRCACCNGSGWPGAAQEERIMAASQSTGGSNGGNGLPATEDDDSECVPAPIPIPRAHPHPPPAGPPDLARLIPAA